MINFASEVYFRTARSGGKGGQHVNKVETAAEACWPVQSSGFFSQAQKEMILGRLGNRINSDGLLTVKSTEARGQLANKKHALERMLALVNQSIIPRVKRISTKPSKRVIERRLESKKAQAEKKFRRKKDW